MRKETKFIYNIILPPIIVYGIHLTLFPLYYIWPNFDIITHTLGGAVIAWGWITIQKRYEPKLSKWFAILTTIGIVMLIATLWEFHEFLLDKINTYGPLHQPTAQDTVGDYFFGLLGAIIVSLFKIKKTANK